MSDKKICSDCKYLGFGATEPGCRRIISIKQDIVYGPLNIMDQRSCYEIREDESSCGPEGKFFEQKPEPAIDYAATVKRILEEATEDYTNNKKPDWWRIKRYFA